MADVDLVKSTDNCIINLQNDGRYVLVTGLAANGWVKAWKKTKFPAGQLVGQPWGALFEVQDNALKRIETEPDVRELLRLAKASGADNRNIKMAADAQGLSQEEIETMKKEGKKPEEIIAALMANSATLEAKTPFAQEKWLKKKMAKYVSFFRLVRPTAENVARAFWMREPEKIEGLRWDALGWMLNAADLRHGSRPLIFDGVNGLLSGAAAERMYGQAESITAIYQTTHQPKHIPSFFNFPPHVAENLKFVPYPQFMAQVPHERFHSLMVAVGYNPNSLVQALWPALIPGSPFVIYSQFPSAFEGLMLWLRQNQFAVETRVNEIFFRQYQVLENRSHPFMQMQNASGFVLTGIKVVPSADESNPQQVEAAARKLEKKSKQQKSERKDAFREKAANDKKKKQKV